MNLETSTVQEELQGIRQQLTGLHQQLAALAEQQAALYHLVSRLQVPRSADRKSAAAVEPPFLAPAQEVLAECAQDISRVLREVGHPLTMLEILNEVVRRELRWRESTISHTLAYLTEHGFVGSSGEGPPHRYQLQPSPALDAR